MCWKQLESCTHILKLHNCVRQSIGCLHGLSQMLLENTQEQATWMREVKSARILIVNKRHEHNVTIMSLSCPGIQHMSQNIHQRVWGGFLHKLRMNAATSKPSAKSTTSDVVSCCWTMVVLDSVSLYCMSDQRAKNILRTEELVVAVAL